MFRALGVCGMEWGVVGDGSNGGEKLQKMEEDARHRMGSFVL